MKDLWIRHACWSSIVFTMLLLSCFLPSFIAGQDVSFAVTSLLARRIVAFEAQSDFLLPLQTNSTEGANSASIDYEAEHILALRWKLVQNSVSYDGLRFDVHYTVSDFVQSGLVRYALYDGPGCSASANFITHMNFFDVWVTEDSTPLGSGLGTKEMTLSTQIIPANITKSKTYKEIGSDAQVEYCVRVSLHSTDVSDPAAIEVNHHETSVSLMVDLKDKFSIQSQSVEAKDAGVETAEDSFYIDGFLCTLDGRKVFDTVPFLQGQTVRVCVQPTQQALDIGLRMRTIDRFTFWQGYVSQEAIINQRTSINGLTQVWCEQGSEQCMFETLLMAYFFKGPSTVDGDGLASLQFGSGTQRLLRSSNKEYQNEERRLQGSQKSMHLDRFAIQSYGHLLSQPNSSHGTPLPRLQSLTVLSLLILLLVTVLR